MTFSNPSDEVIRRILGEAKTIAVVGLSNNESRDSYQVAKYLQQHGYRIIPINPNVSHVLGEPSQSSLTDISEDVDIIDIFRRSDALPDIVEDALKLTTPVIWAQLGVVDDKAADRAEQHAKTVIMDRCIKIEHHRLM